MLTEKPHIIHLYYSLFLIIIGIAAFVMRYLFDGDLQFTALIPMFFGIILVSLTSGMKKGNSVISHLAVTITFLLVVMTVVMLSLGIVKGVPFSRKTIIFILIILASIFVLGVYIARFRGIRRAAKSER